jgi:hypothetical protein
MRSQRALATDRLTKRRTEEAEEKKKKKKQHHQDQTSIDK